MTRLRYTLHRGQTEVHLRSKTAQLLHELITRRDHVATKRELIHAVWKSDHVPDQSLFQAISELRRALAPLEPIRTVPNRGHRRISLEFAQTLRSGHATHNIRQHLKLMLGLGAVYPSRAANT